MGAAATAGARTCVRAKLGVAIATRPTANNPATRIWRMKAKPQTFCGITCCEVRGLHRPFPQPVADSRSLTSSASSDMPPRPHPPQRRGIACKGPDLLTSWRQIFRTLSQFRAQVLAEDHPAVAQFRELFGHHTFFLDARGLHVLELLEVPGMEARDGEVIRLAE
jgi:hypothetical protein